MRTVEWAQRENERFRKEYRQALLRYEDSVVFWRRNPIAYSVTPGEEVPATTLDTLLEADRVGTPDQRCREATKILEEWRAFRDSTEATLSPLVPPRIEEDTRPRRGDEPWVR